MQVVQAGSRATCPKCKGVHLVDLVVKEGTGPQQCPSCAGLWLPPGALKATVALRAGIEVAVEPGTGRALGDSKAGLCPNGHGILIRALGGGPERWYLERCGACHGVWFDGGEWLRWKGKSEEELDRLWAVLDAKLERELDDEAVVQDLKRGFGVEWAQRIVELGILLENHENAEEALNYLHRMARR